MVRLYRVYAEQNRVEECVNFGAIGIGADLAEPSLYQRGYHQYWGAENALYAIFEAQTHGAKLAPMVGTHFLMYLFEQKRGWPINDLRA